MNTATVFDEVSPEKRAQEIFQKHGATLNALISTAIALAENPSDPSPSHLGMYLYFVATEISNRISPLTPCSKGCSHCCKMAITVSSFEADQITLFTGKPKDENAGMGAMDFMAVNANGEYVKQYSGTPCTFLREGKCSIYPVRPMVCRTHHSLMATEEDCIIDPTAPEAKQIGTLDFTAFDNVKMAVMQSAGCTYSDIRRWFPQG